MSDGTCCCTQTRVTMSVPPAVLARDPLLRCLTAAHHTAEANHSLMRERVSFGLGAVEWTCNSR